MTEDFNEQHGKEIGVRVGATPDKLGGDDRTVRQDGILWYLGIDFGTTGISAVLLNYSTRSVYPIYWLEVAEDWSVRGQKFFRLPSLAYLSVGDGLDGTVQTLLPEKAMVVGPLALNMAEERTAENGLLLQNIKPYLQVTIPHYDEEKSKGKPVLQWSEGGQVSLGWVRKSVQALLGTLDNVWIEKDLSVQDDNSKELSAQSPEKLAVAASGLDGERLHQAIAHLSGVIFSSPANWSETYRFNLREAVLGARLVSSPGQVFFVEEAIATMVGELRETAAGSQWRGQTAIVNSGASSTELTLVDLPYNNRYQLTHKDFKLRSFAYGGNAIDQDIICQLLLTPELQADWPVLGGPMKLPKPGDPDLVTRYRLQQRLQDGPKGRNLLWACKHIKQVLQRENSFTLELSDLKWVVRRRDLEMRVLLPFLRRLNREFNALLAEAGVPVEAVNQALCTGGSAAFPPIARWLRQKLPSAAIVQDTYPPNRPPVCSRVAYGLATLPLFPQVLDLPRQQYNDYFLLKELLRYPWTDQPLSLEEIIQLLQLQGINTRVCQQQIRGFLDGNLPPGLVPNAPDRVLLTERHSSEYASLTEEPLFHKEGDQIYRLNFPQRDRLRQYLDRVLANSYQTLEEPYATQLGTGDRE